MTKASIDKRLIKTEILEEIVSRFGRIEAMLILAAKATEDDADITDAIKGIGDALTTVVQALDRLTIAPETEVAS